MRSTKKTQSDTRNRELMSTSTISPQALGALDLSRKRKSLLSPPPPSKTIKKIKSSSSLDGGAAPSYIPLNDDSPEPSEPPCFVVDFTGSTPSANAPPPPPPLQQDNREPALCPEQQDLVDVILSGQNVFYTGSAGCGKSTVLRAFVQALKDVGKRVRTAAPTGRASVDINGTTLHSFAGFTPDDMKKPLEKLCEKAHGRALSKRLRETDVLVIDEISMVENHFLERVSEMLKTARGNNRAFGGLQIIVLGDFYQLPPVKPFQFCYLCGVETSKKNGSTVYKCPLHGEYRDEDKWAFRAQCWKEANFHCVNLTSIHRQKDATFISLLEKCRTGRQFSPQEGDLLLNHESHVPSAVRLFATREEVRRINETEFAKLTTEKLVFPSLDGIQILPQHEFELKYKAQRNPQDGSLLCLKEHRFERLLELKEGTQVILLTNLDIERGLINGSQGIIVGWEDIVDKNMPVAHDPSNKTQKVSETRPLIYGDYAATKVESIKEFARRAPVKKLPLVCFDHPRRGKLTIAIQAECSVTELAIDPKAVSAAVSDPTATDFSHRNSIVLRTQIPLLPAWAMSIHKSQGMTLSRVVVDLSRSFEAGQAYVALSRAKDLKGLKVLALGRGMVSSSSNSKFDDGHGPNLEVRQFLEETFGPEVNV